LRLFSFGGDGLALAALALVVFGAIECPPFVPVFCRKKFFSNNLKYLNMVATRSVSSRSLGKVRGLHTKGGTHEVENSTCAV